MSTLKCILRDLGRVNKITLLTAVIRSDLIHSDQERAEFNIMIKYAKIPPLLGQ